MLLAASAASAVPALAVPPPQKTQTPCAGPPAMVARLRAHPGTDSAVVLGSWYAGRQQFNCAIDVFQGALKTDPKSAQLHYLEGLALLGMAHPAEALPVIEEAARLQPEVLKPHLVLGYLYDQANRHTDAEDQWKKALAIDRSATPALEGLSNDLLARQDYIDVIGLLNSAPRTEKLAIDLSRAFGQMNYLDQANQVLSDALNRTPGSVPLASALTVVLVKQLRYQDAINLLQNTVQKNPGNFEAELQLFRLLVLTNHINLARPMAPKLLAKRPHDPEVLYLNGIVERILGNYADSKAHLEEAVNLDPNFFNSRYNLGMVLVFLKEWKEAAEQLQKAIDFGATEPQVHFELAKALRGLGQMEQATDEMKKYQALKKEDEAKLEAGMNAAQGDKDLDAGKVQEALVHYRLAADGAPDSPNYKFKLAIALHRAGDTAGERAQLEQAVKLDPRLAGAQKQLGLLLWHSGDLEGAVEHYRMAVQAEPAWTEAWISLAAALAEDAHFVEAHQAVDMALRLDPKNAQAQELSDQLARDPAARQPAN
jgi:tetratricopeptide (TPR) repeat protein